MTSQQPSNLEPRVERLEVDLQEVKQIVAGTARNIADLQRGLSELRSDVSTLAEVAGLHEQQLEESRRLHEESRRRFDEYVERSDRDRALMLQLIQAIAQGRNGGQ